MSKKENYYYDIRKDLEEYDDAIIYIIVGGRNTGKTYSALKYTYEEHIKHVFIKRTNEDVDLLCKGGSKEVEVDLSPYKSLNRDLGTNVKAKSVFKGMGAFYEYEDEEEDKVLLPIGYLVSLNAIGKVKGFDLSECDMLIFDEFIPPSYERRINRQEGEMTMELYKTVSRDREHRGKKPLKLVCLANATSISNPMFNTLEITDTVLEMQTNDIETCYLEERGIFIRLLKDSDEFYKQEKKSKIYKAMEGTKWCEMSLNNSFAYNDFSSVERVKLKSFVPICSLKYKNDLYYVYRKDRLYYMTTSRFQADKTFFDLNKENDQKKFFLKYQIELRMRCIDGFFKFEKYTMYDLIMNYKQIFKL